MGVLSQPDVSKQFAKNYISVHVDSGDLTPNDPRHGTVERHNSSGLHPVLVFLDAKGKEVFRFRGGLRSGEDALLLDRYVSGRHYLKSDFNSFRAARKG